MVEIGADEGGVPRLHALHEGDLETGAAEIGPVEIGAAQVGVPQVGAGEIGAREIGAAEIGVLEIGVPQIGAGAPGLGRDGAAVHDPRIGPLLLVEDDRLREGEARDEDGGGEDGERKTGRHGVSS